MVIGYESIVASLILITSTIVLRLNKNTEKKYISVILFSTLSGVMSFVQPRYLATSLILILVIFFREFKRKDFVNLTSIALIILILSPLSLGLRNKNAVDKFFVSNNLGITMNVGAGFESTGGYTNKATGVKCDPTPKSDIQLVTCVVRWYMTNPSEIARLSFNKTLYFFSPWSGPLANGTMARNPWQKINPVMQISKTPGGSQTIYGSFGKAVSWVWFVGQLALMVWGGLWLWRQGAELKKLSIVAGITIATSWLISLGTIGDHRFRLPVMGLMILLQVAGIRGLSKRPLILKPAGKKR
jgi:hypothetical protein